MKLLVTGGGGFLGSYLVKELLNDGHEVVSLSRNRYVELEVEQIQCDLSNSEQVNALDLSDFDGVFHVASKAGVWGSYDSYYQANVVATENLVNRVKEFDIKYFIYTSTPSVVFEKDDILNGDESLPYPERYLTNYAKTKSMAEQFVLGSNASDFQTIAIRPHLIWGPGDPHILPRLKEKAMTGRLKIVGDGQNLVDIIYVKNAARAHADALKAMQKRDIGGNAYFIGQETPVNLWEFINKLLAMSGQDVVIDDISFRKAYFAGSVLENLFKFAGINKPEPPMTRFVATQLAKSHYFSHEKAKRDFDFKIEVSIEEGLERIKETTEENKKYIN